MKLYQKGLEFPNHILINLELRFGAEHKEAVSESFRKKKINTKHYGFTGSEFFAGLMKHTSLS